MNDREIFEAGSTTYYWSSKFFPKGVRDDVFKLYSFVRIVDDYVDRPNPDVKNFEYIVKRWKVLKKTLHSSPKKRDDTLNERVLHNICYIVHRYDCDPAWVDAFLKSMQMDIKKREYATIDETLEYIYGSAEVIGLFMARILRLKPEADEFARAQGRAMQYVNFIRDIAEDQELGRQYFPADELALFGFKNVSQKEAMRKQPEFREFMEAQVDRYHEWQKQANKGFKYIPRPSRVAVRTAVDMYNWTADIIRDNPTIVYSKKIKPSKTRIIRAGLKRGLYA